MKDGRGNNLFPNWMLSGGEGDYFNTRLPLSQINVLPQPRKTFSEIAELAQAIAYKKLLKPPIVARWDETGCQHYLDFVNDVWKTSWTVKDLHSVIETEKPVYYVLLAGERRFRACRMLWEIGCPECQEVFGQNKEPGECFRRHFGCDTLEVRIANDVPAFDAAEIQQMENNHKPVPIHQEAWSFVLMYRVLKKGNPQLSVAAFARKIGRSAETVRKAMRYCDLPEKVQKLVEEGKIAFGLALESCRLSERGASSEVITTFVVDAAASGYTVPEFRAVVRGYIQDLDSGQGQLFDIIEGDNLSSATRQVVAGKSIRSVHAAIAYLNTVKRLIDDGLLGAENAPFSERSPRRVIRNLTSYLKSLHGQLAHILGSRSLNKLTEAVEGLEAGLKQLDQKDDPATAGNQD